MPSISFMFALQLIAMVYRASSVVALALQVKNDGWRIAMDIGREPGTAMPADWAQSGCRLPLVVRCDFLPPPEGRIEPKSRHVRFTGPDGEVVNRIEGGKWVAKSSRNAKGGLDLTFDLSFPEELVRRDVRLQGTVRCVGVMYSTEALKDLDNDYYRARDAKWEAGKVAAEVVRRREAPKKWNFDTERWEKRYEEEGLLSHIGKRASYMLAERKERLVTETRPNPKDLSFDCGPFPEVKGNVYMKKKGKVTLVKGWREQVIGTWSAEPINDKPVSYY